MTDTTTICNLALSKLGETSVVNLIDPTNRNEELCKLWLPICRKAALETAEWSFATKRVRSLAIPPKTDVDAHWGFANRHLIPDGCLRLLEVRETPEGTMANALDWQTEDDWIVTDADEVYIRYLSDITDGTRYPAAFVKLLAGMLAYELCLPITENKELYGQLRDEFRLLRSEAVNTDSLQGRTRRLRATKLTSWR